ncbi:hypothetical protein [Herbidospora mongoliensis]|uniref:hypothetical protein n=1 Tax=Herbidospora mongoliensis TaxID=688067 RepID=UPI0012F9117D|nr:hypothetical protein [Herbidospora mongoliensis]
MRLDPATFAEALRRYADVQYHRFGIAGTGRDQVYVPRLAEALIWQDLTVNRGQCMLAMLSSSTDVTDFTRKLTTCTHLADYERPVVEQVAHVTWALLLISRSSMESEPVGRIRRTTPPDRVAKILKRRDQLQARGRLRDRPDAGGPTAPQQVPTQRSIAIQSWPDMAATAFLTWVDTTSGRHHACAADPSPARREEAALTFLLVRAACQHTDRLAAQELDQILNHHVDVVDDPGDSTGAADEQSVSVRWITVQLALTRDTGTGGDHPEIEDGPIIRPFMMEYLTTGRAPQTTVDPQGRGGNPDDPIWEDDELLVRPFLDRAIPQQSGPLADHGQHP